MLNDVDDTPRRGSAAAASGALARGCCWGLHLQSESRSIPEQSMGAGAGAAAVREPDGGKRGTRHRRLPRRRRRKLFK
jgi:hypothetical protein